MSESNKLLPQAWKVTELLPVLHSTADIRGHTQPDQKRFQTALRRNPKEMTRIAQARAAHRFQVNCIIKMPFG